jgi:uncharacterized damage-inducible protein DinB
VGGFNGDQLPDVNALCSIAELLPHARVTHDWERMYVAKLDDAALARIVDIPLPGTLVRISVTQVLAQSAMHGQHHRAQNATRFRELGGEPPTTDLILWYMLERPEAPWGISA